MPYDRTLPEASEDLPLTGLLAPAAGNTPEQFHLAYTGEGGMYVSWASGSSSPGSAQKTVHSRA